MTSRHDDDRLAGAPMDLALLQARILEAFRRRCPEASPPSCRSAAAGPVDPLPSRLAGLELYVELDSTVPAMQRLPWLLRPPVRLAGRIVLGLLRFLIRQQIDCNRALVDALRDVHRAGQQRLTDLERELAGLRADLRRLEARSADAPRSAA